MGSDSERLKELQAEIKRIRNWAGDNLPASEGLTLIVKLEKALEESKCN